MNVYIALSLCFIPLLLSFLFIIKFTDIKITTYLFASLLGLLAIIPISILQIIFSAVRPLNSAHWLTQLLRAILFNGLIEETIKMAVLFLLKKSKLKLKQFFLCSFVCGISLGCFESAIYFLQYLQKANTEGATLLYSQIFMRMFTTDLVHAFCAGLGGLFVWSIKNKKIDIMPISLAIVLHGLYNFFALYNGLKIFSFATILFMIVQCRISYSYQAERKTRRKKTT